MIKMIKMVLGVGGPKELTKGLGLLMSAARVSCATAAMAFAWHLGPGACGCAHRNLKTEERAKLSDPAWPLASELAHEHRQCEMWQVTDHPRSPARGTSLCRCYRFKQHKVK